MPLPAIRALVALPATAQASIMEFVELVPGVPLTQEVQKRLEEGEYYQCEPKSWKFIKRSRQRSIRQDGSKVTKVTHEMVVYAYFADKELPPLMPESQREHLRYELVWDWSGDTDFIAKLTEAKNIVKRIKNGELCRCRHWLTEKGCRLCRQCAVKEFMNS